MDEREPRVVYAESRGLLGWNVLTTEIPLSEVLAMYRTCLALARRALAGDAAARRDCEIVMGVAASDARLRGRAVVSAYLLREAFEESRAERESFLRPAKPESAPEPAATAKVATGGEVAGSDSADAVRARMNGAAARGG